MAIAPWIAPAVIVEYAHGLTDRLRRQFVGHRRHSGDAAAIVRACIEACWNGRTFTASPGHFDMFWTRDLSFSVPSLVRLGYGPRVRTSLAFALRIWTKRHSHITTTIHPFNRPGDVYEYGVDSLPLFMAALRSANATDLVERYRDWLTAEIAHYYERVVDPFTGLVRADRKFSAHRDTVINHSTAHGNTMVALLAKTLAETGWFASPFERHFRGDYGRLLMAHFWDGDHFRDALGEETVSGEANIWPFYTGVVADRATMAAALAYLDANGFCDPYPLRYETSRRPDREVWLTRYLLPDYQGTTVWTSLGSMYLQVLRLVSPELAAAETARYVAWIERDGTFWEVMNNAGENWVSPRWIMIGEESMLWSAIFLDILENGAMAPALLIAAGDAGARRRGLSRRGLTALPPPRPPSTGPRQPPAAASARDSAVGPVRSTPTGLARRREIAVAGKQQGPDKADRARGHQATRDADARSQQRARDRAGHPGEVRSARVEGSESNRLVGRNGLHQLVEERQVDPREADPVDADDQGHEQLVMGHGEQGRERCATDRRGHQHPCPAAAAGRPAPHEVAGHREDRLRRPDEANPRVADPQHPNVVERDQGHGHAEPEDEDRVAAEESEEAPLGQDLAR